MGLKTHGAEGFPAVAISLLVLPKSLIRREKFADSVHRELST
jgi:hypothetical protein